MLYSIEIGGLTLISDSEKILIGIFSYNEGENLTHMYNQIKLQCKGLNYEIVLIDDSDEVDSVSIVNEIVEKDNTKILRGENRRGKIQGYNLLYDMFLKNDYDVLLHFDADHILSNNAIFYLVKSIHEGFEIATCFNQPIKPIGIFQRALYVMFSPATFQRENRIFDFPLVGHNGAYNRKAVQKIGIIPYGGIDEEMYVLSKVLENDLSYTIVLNAICYFLLPGTLTDYMATLRRISGKVKTFNRYINAKVTGVKKVDAAALIKKIYSRPPLRVIVKSLFSDPTASMFVPFILFVRWIVIKHAKIYTSDTWVTIKTTKMLYR